MATQGLSLVGYLDQSAAVQHLQTTCVATPPTKSASQLIVDWQTARANLGAPTARARSPKMSPIGLSHPHIQNLLQNAPWAADVNALVYSGATFCNIEIDPLLAFQFTVDVTRSQQHCNNLAAGITAQNLLDLCLPVSAPPEDLHISFQNESTLIRCRNLNLRLLSRGPLGHTPGAFGIQIGFPMPLVHVTRYKGQCYLHNGFHRTYGARLAGAVDVPCIFRDVNTPEEAGINPPQTFDLTTLQSTNPPTVGHFTQGRAHAVDLRLATRLIQVNWSEHVMFEE